jgi:hypothetical protein
MHLSGNTDEFLLELILGCGINLRVKHSEAGGTWIITISAKRHWNSYHLALDLGGIRRPVNKYNFVARIAIRSGVPERTGGEAGGSQRTKKRKTKEEDKEKENKRKSGGRITRNHTRSIGNHSLAAE